MCICPITKVFVSVRIGHLGLSGLEKRDILCFMDYFSRSGLFSL